MQTVALAPSPLREALSRVAKAVVRCMGGHCEVSLYDLGNVKSPLLYRAGTLASGRDTGLPDQIGAGLRQTGGSGEELVFFSRTATGRTLKNTVTFLTDEGASASAAPRYACCITLDVTALVGQLDFLESMLEDVRAMPSPDPRPAAEPLAPSAPMLIRAQPGSPAPRKGMVGSVTLMEAVPGGELSRSSTDAVGGLNERRNLNGPEALSAHIAEALRHVAVPVSLMTNHDRMRLVEHLEERGVFLLKGAVDQVAAALSVTRYTVYYYLKKMRA